MNSFILSKLYTNWRYTFIHTYINRNPYKDARNSCVFYQPFPFWTMAFLLRAARPRSMCYSLRGLRVPLLPVVADDPEAAPGVLRLRRLLLRVHLLLRHQNTSKPLSQALVKCPAGCSVCLSLHPKQRHVGVVFLKYQELNFTCKRWICKLDPSSSDLYKPYALYILYVSLSLSSKTK